MISGAPRVVGPSTSIAHMTASASPRKLDEVAAAAGDLLVRIEGDHVPVVTGVAFDSRRVSRGDLFFCVPGAVTDGHLFAGAAAGAGAVALCVERPTQSGLPEIVVTDVRPAMGRIGAAWFGHPADDLLTLAVTGTNGKTTTAFLIESILRAAGRTPGLIGTIETRIPGRSRPGVRTTPESLDLQALLAEIQRAGGDSVAMEVTSHALALHRIEGMRCDVAAFTNLSQDHLDFHESMEDYGNAKRSLFTPERAERGAVNIDDPFGRTLLEEAALPCLAFGLLGDADVRATDVHLGVHGSEFTVQTPYGDINISTPLVGAFNVSNCLAAGATAVSAGIDPGAVEAGINGLTTIPGRFESVTAGQPFTVVVDYAHTPDSLDNVLRSARELVSARDGRVLVVFGCGGDRDRGKRPLMGAVAARLADYVVVTSDNPRTEDPHGIINDIIEGVVAERSSGADVVEADRRISIDHALRSARSNDIVVVAGKGHETGQQFADHTIPFDDRVVVREVLAGMGWSDS
jgi:UDP-N-acetylmuramoyl-L-alanyl-D-glutamate--2,6-diaminopimelate ligase